MLRKTNILGVNITNEKEEKVLEYVMHALENSSEKLFVVTPNPEIIMYAKHNKSFRDNLNEATVALPDGVGVLLSGLFLGQPFKERITGVDFMDRLCEKAEENAMSIGFLGGKSGVAQRTAQCLLAKYPRLKVVFASDEWDKKLINSSKPPKIDILFVAFGFPKQENWIHKHLPEIPVRLAMGVGGAFDYISGDVVRAPYLVRAMGFEWLFRLIVQPWRFKRQLALLYFVKAVIVQRFHTTSK